MITPQQALANRRVVEQTPITNQCWTMDESGLLVSEMSAATIGGGEVIYDPWGQPIMNTAIRTRYAGDGIDREVAGWDVTFSAPGGIYVEAYIANV